MVQKRPRQSSMSTPARLMLLFTASLSALLFGLGHWTAPQSGERTSAASKWPSYEDVTGKALGFDEGKNFTIDYGRVDDPRGTFAGPVR